MLINSYDDSFDFADGYQGTATNVYIKGVTKAGVEGSNNEKNPDTATPMTDAKLVNFSIVKGDAKFISIAAASILAKTHRDELMEEMAQKFPGYDWEKNKGYPTKKHRAAIEKLGATPLHRQSFKLLDTQLKLNI